MKDMKEFINNKSFGKPSFVLVPMATLLSMVCGGPLLLTVAVILISWVIGVVINGGTHKTDWVYLILAFLLLIGYAMPNFVNLAS